MAVDPKPNKTIYDLLKSIDSGDYVIPYFQRGYEWTPSMVADLLTSIVQDYFSGLILFWELDSGRAKEETWDPLWGAPKSQMPSTAILDGQQRLASLYYALYGPKEKFPNRKSYCSFFLNLDRCINKEYEEVIEHPYSSKHLSLDEIKEKRNEWIEKGVLPLTILSDKDYMNSKDFEEWLKEYVDKKQEKAIIPSRISTLEIYQMLQKILDYSFVTHTLGKDRPIKDICDIFARINQKGMKLSTFDLMNAFLYPKGIRLRKDWEDFDNEKLKSVDISNMNEYLLKLISLYKQNYCSSKYIYNLIPGEKTKQKDISGKVFDIILVKDKDEFKELWKSSCKYAEKARIVLMNVGENDFGAIKSEFIPNTPIVPLLGAILLEYENNPIHQYISNSDFTKMLIKWYWSAVLSGEYSGSAESVMSKDYRDIKNWLNGNGEIERTKRINNDFIENELDLRTAKKGSSVYNAILCILSLNKAEDFYTIRILGTGDYAAESINDHHIFPSKVKGLHPDKSNKFKETKDFILNRTLLLDETNNDIKAKKPSVYLNKILKEKLNGNNDKLKDLMKKHFISDDALKFLWEDNYDDFIMEREETIKEHIKLTLGMK